MYKTWSILSPAEKKNFIILLKIQKNSPFPLKYLFVIIIQMMVLLNSSANSAETYLKIFSLSNDYSQSKVWSGVFVAPNGKTFDTSVFGHQGTCTLFKV